MEDKKTIKTKLVELLETHYNGSFIRMVCEYIRVTEMTQDDVEELLEAMKHLRK